ncbi:glycoside hydrolase family 36 protein [Polyangium spumosum]|uniref:Alpha-galactosidase n=1 Tax=Polyangium spumosum TaxID=889282 RepID=A0A6N7PXR8_9BACT|nr:glycoside hydrolase family 36 protein [Polyangium spumosum]MRG96337.1 hypothetical protein [Polyangium spumosum]
MRLSRPRGELRYRTRRGTFFLHFDASRPGLVEDGKVRLAIAEDAGDGLSVTLHADVDLAVEALTLRYEFPVREGDRFFLNGYQSWTDTREFSPDERIHPFPPLARPALERFFRTNHYGDYDIVPPSGRSLHGFTYFYLREAEGSAIELLGSLSEREGFTVFRVLPEEGRLVVQKDCEGLNLRAGSTWKALRLHRGVGDEHQVFDTYLRRFHATSGVVPRPAAPGTGWTSWYYHYTNINESIALKNLDAFSRRRIPIDVFQLDDGWQGAVGDWLDVNTKFPRGLAFLAERIHEAGYRAGLWLAPFVAEKSSRLVADHPAWLLRDERGEPVPAGNSALWSGDFYGLDPFHPGLRDHLARVFDTILGAWAMDLVKLDFLYGACLVPRHGKTRGEMMTCAMELARELVGDKMILGCGVPLGPAFGRVEYCRIGPDVGHEWKNTLTRGLGIRETISTVTALENAVGRHHLSGRAFLNDPDVFFLRDLSFGHERFDPFLALQQARWGKKQPLSRDEKYTLFLLNNLFGRLVFTSDDIDEYDDEVMDLYLSSFPLREKEDVRASLAGAPPAFGEVGGFYEVHFRIGELRYTVLANLSDAPARRALEKDAFSRGIRGEACFHSAGEVVSLPPHASICLLEDGGAEARLVGSTSSLFPGSDIHSLAPDGEGGLRALRAPRARGRGLVFLRPHAGEPGARVNGVFISAKPHGRRGSLVAIPAASLPEAPAEAVSRVSSDATPTRGR